MRTRVLLQPAAGADEITAFRNAFEKPKSAIDAKWTLTTRKASSPTVTIAGRPLDAERAFL